VQDRVIEDFPTYDVEGTRDQRDQNADCERAAKADLTVADVIPIGFDTKEHEQKGNQHRGVADNDGAVETDPVREQSVYTHQYRYYHSGNYPERHNRFLQGKNLLKRFNILRTCRVT
jgi:hypothetical protein